MIKWTFTERSADRISKVVQAVERSDVVNLTPPSRRHKQASGSAFGTMPFMARLTGWNASPDLDYDWVEVWRGSSSDSWVTKTGGRTSAEGDSSSATVSKNAQHVNNIEDLPDNLIVVMFQHIDEEDVKRYSFTVPVQLDSVFAHRTLLTNSPTLGDREDRTLSGAQMIDVTGSGPTPAEYGLEDQGTSVGWVETVMVGLGYDTTNKKFVLKAKDLEFDVMGRKVSESDIMTTDVIDLVLCST